MASTATSLALSTSCEGQEKCQGSAGRTGRYRSVGELATPGAQGCLDPLGPGSCSLPPRVRRWGADPGPGEGYRGRLAGWVLTGQVVLPHSIRLPERPAVPSAAFPPPAGPRPPPLLHHLPVPPTCRPGRHVSDPPATAASRSFPVRCGRAALCHVSSQGLTARDATRKAAWDL